MLFKQIRISFIQDNFANNNMFRRDNILCKQDTMLRAQYLFLQTTVYLACTT